MDYTSQILFFFGAIGVFNSILISLYFIFIKKPVHFSNRLFGLFLLFLSERALRSLIYFFSDTTSNAYSTFGPITFIFIGPFLFFYVISALKPGSRIISYWKYHILFWIATALGIHFIYPFRADPIFWKRNILVAINIQWLLYLLASIYVLFKSKEGEQEKTDYFSGVKLWILCLLSSTLILWTIFFFVDLSYFIIGSITFSVLFYSFFLYFFFRKKQASLIFQNDIKYADKKIDDNRANTLLEQLYTYMREQKPYRNPALKSLDVAGQLNISTHQLSQLLNDNLGKSFAVFVNEYRIEEAKRIIRDNTKYTLEAIGNESGFNSKSTFYTTFKRIVGKTPAKYKEQF